MRYPQSVTDSPHISELDVLSWTSRGHRSRSQRAKLRTWSATDRLGSSGTPEMRGPMLDSKHPTFGGQKCAPPNRCSGAPSPELLRSRNGPSKRSTIRLFARLKRDESLD